MSKNVNTWTREKFPVVDGLRAYILPGAFYGNAVAMFAEAGYTKAKDLSDADLVVFMGGEDIHPALYNQTKTPACGSTNSCRDSFEVDIFNKASAAKIPMIGICRGAQILHALNGGELWQHVSGHAGADHWIVDMEEGCRVLSTSIHHQMVQDNDRLVICAVSEEDLSKVFVDDRGTTHAVRGGHDILEIEAGYYPDTKTFFTQGHPEIGGHHYRTWFFTKIFELYFE